VTQFESDIGTCREEIGRKTGKRSVGEEIIKYETACSVFLNKMLTV
jgi:hypothetical protein